MFTALDSHARGMRADGDGRSIRALMCDTLVERVTGVAVLPDPVIPDASPGRDRCPDSPGSPSGSASAAAGASGVGSRMAARVELQVVIGASTLLGVDDAPVLLRGYGAISASVARQLVESSQDLWWRRLVCDPVDGRLLAMGSAARLFTGDLRLFARWREQGCRLPCCDGPVRHLDHAREHARGGPTAAFNAQGLSLGCHVLRDHPGIEVSTAAPRPPPAPGEGGSDPGLTLAWLRAQAPDAWWRMPSGHAYRCPPPPVLGYGSTPVSTPVPPRRQPSAGEEHFKNHRLRVIQDRARAAPGVPARHRLRLQAHRGETCWGIPLHTATSGPATGDVLIPKQ